MSGSQQVAADVVHVLHRRSWLEQELHQGTCTEGCMYEVPPQVGEVVDYYPNPNGEFNGPSEDDNDPLTPHFVAVLRPAQANDGSSQGTRGGPEYMCCVITSHPPTRAPDRVHLVLEPGDQTWNRERVHTIDIQAVPEHRWQWLPNTQVAVFAQRFPQFVLHRLLETHAIRIRLDDATIRTLFERLNL